MKILSSAQIFIVMGVLFVITKLYALQISLQIGRQSCRYFQYFSFERAKRGCEKQEGAILGACERAISYLIFTQPLNLVSFDLDIQGNIGYGVS